MATLLGFDFGTRKIGVAVGQTVTATATPLTTLRHRADKPDWPAIEALVREWQPTAAVLGMPHRDEAPVALAEQIQRFARQLQGRFNIPVHLADESFSSNEARRQLKGTPGFREGDHLREDAVAAAVILETWLSEAGRRVQAGEP